MDTKIHSEDRFLDYIERLMTRIETETWHDARDWRKLKSIVKEEAMNTLFDHSGV